MELVILIFLISVYKDEHRKHKEERERRHKERAYHVSKHLQ